MTAHKAARQLSRLSSAERISSAAVLHLRPQEKKSAEQKGDFGGSGINKFLNRLLAVRVGTQTKIFQYFMALLVRLVSKF